MNEQLQQKVQQYLGEGRDSQWIANTLYFEDSNVDFNEVLNYATSLAEPKKKDLAPEPSIGEMLTSPMSDSLDASSESSLTEAEPVQQAETRESEGRYNYQLYNFGDYDPDPIAYSSWKSMSDMSAGIPALLEKDADRKAEVDSFLEANKIGDEREIVKTEYGPDGPMQIRSTIPVTQATIDEGVKAIDDKYEKMYYGQEAEKIKEAVLAGLPEEKLQDEEFLANLGDKMYFEYGIALDLDGNGRYNEQSAFKTVGNQLARGFSSMGGALTYLHAAAQDIPYLLSGQEGWRSKLVRGQVEETQQYLSEGMTHFEMGISDSFKAGDFGGAFTQLAGGVAETTPIIATTIATGGTAAGALTVGALGGTQAYMEVADDEEMTEAGKISYAIANGGSDLLFASVGGSIMNSAAKSAQIASQVARETAKKQGRKITGDMVLTYAREKVGVAMLPEAAEEYATGITTRLVEDLARGNEVDLRRYMGEAIDDALIGASAGPLFHSAGSMKGKIRAGASSRFDAKTAKQQDDLRRAKDDLEARAKVEADPKAVETINSRIVEIEREISRIQNDREPFYEMMAVRHPNAMDEILTANIEIESTIASINRLQDPEAKEVLRGRLESLVAKRTELENRFADEDVTLTKEEKASRNKERVKTAIEILNEDFQMAKESFSVLQEDAGAQGFDYEALETAQVRFEEVKDKRNQVLRAMGDVEAARTNLAEMLETVESAEAQSVKNAEESLKLAEEQLAETLDLPLDKVNTVVENAQVQEDVAQQVEARKSDGWIQSAIEGYDNSSLNKEDVEAILKSDNFAMLTAENPNAIAVGDDANKSYNDKAKAWFKSEGLKFHEIAGRYENGENSFLVEGMTRDQAIEFAREFDQESVAHKDGLVTQDGSINPFEDGVDFDIDFTDASRDFFSAIKDTEGNVVAFSLAPSGTYLDARGKAITEAQFYAQEFDGDALDAELGISEDVKSDFEDLNVLKDGTVRVPDGIAGLNSKDQASLQKMANFISSLYGDKMSIRIHKTADSSDLVQQGMGGLVDFDTMTLHISPDGIRKNAEFEAEQAGLKRVKSFQETLMEEVGHAAISPVIMNMSDVQRKKLFDDLVGVVESDKALMDRLQAKMDSYYVKIKDETILYDEAVMEILSAVSTDADNIEISTMNRLRVILNQLLQRAGKAVGFKPTLTENSSAIKMLASFKNLHESGNAFNVARGADLGQRSSKALSVFELPEDGKFKVDFHKTIYKHYGYGDKKDIGGRPVSKEFNGRWHFINWWKVATKTGTDSDLYGFKFNDKPVNVDAMKSWNFKRRSSAVLSKPRYKIAEQSIKAKINEARSAGLIDDTMVAVLNGRLRKPVSKIDRIKASGQGAESARKYMDYINKLDKGITEMIVRRAKAKGVDLNFDLSAEASERAVLRIQKQLSPEERLQIDELRSNKRDYLCEIGAKECSAYSKVTDYEFLSQIVRDQKSDTPAEDALLADMEYNLHTNNSFDVDPLDFYNGYNRASGRMFDKLKMEGNVGKNPAQYKPFFDMIMSVTSNGVKSLENTVLASNIFYNGLLSLKRNGPDAPFVSPTVIDGIRRKDPRYTLGFVRGERAVTVADQLQKVNAKVKEALNEDGKIKEGFIEDYFKQKGSVLRKAQDEFGLKIGAHMINLNGDLSVTTQDSHVQDYMHAVEGKFRPHMEYLQGSSVENLAAFLEVPVSTPIKEMVAKLTELKYTDGPKSKAARRRYSELFAPRPGRVSTKAEYLRRHRVLEATAKKYNKRFDSSVEPANIGQYIYAADQMIASGGRRPGKYTPYGADIDYVLDNNLFRDLSKENLVKIERLQDQRDMEMLEAVLDGTSGDAAFRGNGALTQADELNMQVRPSLQLRMFDGNTVADVESPLFRSRDAAEALRMRDGRVLDKETTETALSTDATSMRIKAKGVQVEPGRQVGIRLNLNVRKNTGVPVQTVHDKSATGEALDYAPVVTVKNPTLYVNQNARKKILTFQENKFPMASVNGEFLSADIETANFDGVKAVFNPFKHNVFVDVSGRPIKSADEATVVGDNVYLRGNIEYYDYSDPILQEGRTETEEQRAKRVKRGPKYDKAIKRFKGYAEKVLGMEFSSEAELQYAYDNMPISSQVAMDESEVVSRMEEAQKRASVGLFMRKPARKAAKKYKDVRSEIINNPENYITRQNIKESKLELEDMTTQELVDLMTDDALGRLQNRNDDLGVLAANELIARAISDGNIERIPEIVEEVSKIGTTAGRLLRHFGELKKASPIGIVQIVRGAVEKRGNRLTEAQDTQLNEIASEMFRLQSEYKQLMQKAIRGEDVEAELKAKEAELKKVEKLLDTFSNAVIERGWGDLGTMLIQGNLLTPMSQTVNVGANVMNAVGKVGVDIIALPVEKLLNIFGVESKYGRKYSVNAYMYGVRKFGQGFVEAAEQIYTGREKDVSEWRINRGFAPFRSLTAALTGKGLPMGVDGKTSNSQRTKLFIQGTLGLPAEIMFRFLSLGDVPFRRFVEGIELYQIAQQKGLSGEALKNFVKYPNKKDQEAAEREGRKLTFQEKTTMSQVAQDLVSKSEEWLAKGLSWIPGTDGRAAAKFLIRSNVPYVQTPANMLMETMVYVTPFVGVPKMMIDIQRNDARSAAQTLGKMVIGQSVAGVTALLIKEGLISGAIEFNEDEEKNLAFDQFPPSSINVSGLQRLIDGGSANKQEDDRFIRYNRLGIYGAIMGTVVKSADREKLRNMDRADIKPDFMDVVSEGLGISGFSAMAHMMDQSFLQGMEGLLDVVSSSDGKSFERNMEKWASNTFKAVTAVALPNSMSAFHRAEREYLPDTRITKDMDSTERLLTRLEYNIKDRTFGTSDLPIRVDWKGNPVKQTPRGNVGWLYSLFDITSARQGEADPVSNEIYRLYEATEELTTVIGTPGYAENTALSVPDFIKRKDLAALRREGLDPEFVKDEDFMKSRVYLNTEQLNRLMEISGKERYAMAEELISSYKYENMTDEERIEALNEVNDSFNSIKEYDGRRLRNHSVEIVNIIEEIYQNERAEED